MADPFRRSKRRLVAERLADQIKQLGLNRPYGGQLSKASDQHAYVVMFASPGMVNGVCWIHSCKFIQVTCDGKGVPGNSWNEVYTTEHYAASFLTALAEGNMQLAEAVPVRERNKC